jgi:hypothetical protein
MRTDGITLAFHGGFSEAIVMQVRIASGRGIVILGLCLLGFSVYRAHVTYRFVKSSVPATGIVWYGSKRMFLVEIPSADGTARYIPTRMPFLALPWSYGRGKAVTILYDPRKTYDNSNPFALFPERARVDAWLHLWLPCLFTGGLGVVLLTLGCLQVARPRRLRTSISVRMHR